MDTMILMGLAAGAILLILWPPRWPRRRAVAKTRAELRREWSQARPHWSGHEGWEASE